MKGLFTRAKLSVATSYIYPAGLRRPYVLGALIAIPVVALFVVNALVGGGTWVSGGPLSSNHAVFGNDCNTCHEPYAAVTNARCESCQEKAGDTEGAYGFEPHYRYRSDEFDRAAPSSKEVACFACHTEHVGRYAGITTADNSRCASCHFQSFQNEHPGFQFIVEILPVPANLFFSHTFHVM